MQPMRNENDGSKDRDGEQAEEDNPLAPPDTPHQIRAPLAQPLPVPGNQILTRESKTADAMLRSDEIDGRIGGEALGLSIGEGFSISLSVQMNLVFSFMKPA